MLFAYFMWFMGTVAIITLIKLFLHLGWGKAVLVSFAGFLFGVGIPFMFLFLGGSYRSDTVYYQLIGRWIGKYFQGQFLIFFGLVWPIISGTVLLQKWICHRWLKSFLVTLAVFIVGGFFFIAGMVPSLSEAQEKAKIASCTINLKQIGLALHMYASDNDDIFPDSLAGLYPKYISSPRVFYCPGEYYVGGICGENLAPDTFDPSKISYTYTSGLTAKADPGEVIVADKSSSNHKGKVLNILYIDGHVKTKRLLLPWYQRIFSTIYGGDQRFLGGNTYLPEGDER